MVRRNEAEQEAREAQRREQFEKLRRIGYMAGGASKFLKTIGKSLSGDAEEILEKQEKGEILMMAFEDMEDLFKDDELDSGKDGKDRKGGKDGKGGKDERDGQGLKDGKDGKGKDGKGKDDKDEKDGKDGRGKDGKGVKDSKDGKDGRGKDGKDGKDGRGKDGKDGKGGKESKSGKEGKGGTNGNTGEGSGVYGEEYLCWKCDKSLYGHRFVNKDGHPYCVDCFHQSFANTCCKCTQLIEADTKDVNFGDRHWHGDCFKCAQCEENLVDKKFGSDRDDIFCTDCYDNKFSPTCERCDQPFKAGALKMNWSGKQWHEECFQCAGCANPIGQEQFHPREGKPYCSDCYDDNFALKCSKCAKAISAGGVNYAGEPYHRECFACSQCDRSLAGQRFTLDQSSLPVCAECFGRHVASECFHCKSPITGVGSGNKYVVFEERRWHCECFYCTACAESLIGANFIAEGGGGGGGGGADDDLELYCQPCGYKKRGWNFLEHSDPAAPARGESKESEGEKNRSRIRVRKT